MELNTLASEQVAVATVINPASYAVGATNSGYVDASKFHRYLAVVQTGVLGLAATVDAKLTQSKDGLGTGEKDVTGKAITQIVKATGDNVQAEINVRPEELDTTNGFSYIRLVVTVGAAASIVGAAVLGVNGRFGPASDFDAATVAQIV